MQPVIPGVQIMLIFFLPLFRFLKLLRYFETTRLLIDACAKSAEAVPAALRQWVGIMATDPRVVGRYVFRRPMQNSLYNDFNNQRNQDEIGIENGSKEAIPPQSEHIRTNRSARSKEQYIPETKPTNQRT